MAIPTDTTRYIGITYGTGVPYIKVQTTDTWDLDTDLTVPPNAVGIMLYVAIRDSGASSADCYATFLEKGGNNDFTVRCFPANDRWNHSLIMLKFDSSNIIQYTIEASGAGTLDLSIELAGWVLK